MRLSLQTTAGLLRLSRQYSQGLCKPSATFEKLHMEELYAAMRNDLASSFETLTTINEYYLDGKGKATRPQLVYTLAQCANQASFVTSSQMICVRVAELLHTASLIHDDLIDKAGIRRGKKVVGQMYGERMSVFASNFIVATSSKMLAQLNEMPVVTLFSRIVEDLVSGEFMQLRTKQLSKERFPHYIERIFKKTASLMAHSCEAVVYLSPNSTPVLRQKAFEFGRNFGIAFQLQDDILDFVSNTSTLGKPTTIDLRLGLATAPVLFAAQTEPHLDQLISRRFSKVGDVETALNLVNKSDGVAQAAQLATNYAQRALNVLTQTFHDTPARIHLENLLEFVIDRKF